MAVDDSSRGVGEDAALIVAKGGSYVDCASDCAEIEELVLHHRLRGDLTKIADLVSCIVKNSVTDTVICAGTTNVDGKTTLLGTCQR